jgi:3-oxoacyl-(acyl-carrier-protein) synthase
MNPRRVVITGTGAVCAAGRDPPSILEAVRAGRSAIAPIRQWDASGWPMQTAGEISDLNPRALVDDRKLHKLIRRTDLFGLYAADRAIDASGLSAHRAALEPEAALEYSDRTGVYVGSGGGSYESQYDYFPLLTAAQDKLPASARAFQLGQPMWLLRTLPNNVLGHIIRHAFKGRRLYPTTASAARWR